MGLYIYTIYVYVTIYDHMLPYMTVFFTIKFIVTVF